MAQHMYDTNEFKLHEQGEELECETSNKTAMVIACSATLNVNNVNMYGKNQL